MVHRLLTMNIELTLGLGQRLSSKHHENDASICPVFFGIHFDDLGKFLQLEIGCHMFSLFLALLMCLLMT